MPIDEYLAGVAWFAIVFGSVGVSAAVVLRRQLGHLSGSAAGLAYGLIATAGLMAVHLAPGALGILAPGSVAVTALALVAGTWRLVPARPAQKEVRPAPPSSRLQWGLALAALVLVGVYTVALVLDRRGFAVTGIDILTFEMPTVVNWIQEGTVWPVHTYWYGWSFGNYPMNGDLIALSVTLPWRTDAWLRFGYLPFHLMTGLGAYGLARELGAARAIGVSVAALLMAIPIVVLTPLDLAKPDPVMFACFLAGVTFLVRHARTHATGDLVLGGLGVGLAVGTKWYGLTCAVVAMLAWTAGRLASRRQWREIRRTGAVLAGVIAAAGGFWLVRNLVSSGNPVFPQKVELFGVTLFDASRDWRRETHGQALVDYLGDWDIWEHLLLPDMRDGFGLAGLLFGLALVAVVVLGMRRRMDGRTLLVAVGGLALLTAYAFTPYTAQLVGGVPHAFPGLRYAVPGVAVGAAVGACVLAPGRAWIGQAVVLGAIVDAIYRVEDTGVGVLRATRILPAIAVLVVAAGAVALLRRRPPGQRALFVLAGCTVLAALAAGYAHHDRYMDGRYRGIDATTEWVLEHADSGRSIGVAGRIRAAGRGSYADLAPIAILPLYGPRFGNEVEVMGRERDSRLYGPPGRRDFEAQVRRRRYDLLVLVRPPEEAEAPEEAWAGALGYEPVARGRIAAVMVARHSRQSASPG